MRGTSLKLCCVAFIVVAFASSEARHKAKHDSSNCHHPVKPSPVSPTEAPTTKPSPSPSPSPTPTLTPSYEGYDGKCGSPCYDENECTYPCYLCCYANKTCCDGNLFIPPLPLPPPSPSPIIEAPTPQQLPPTLAPSNNDIESPPTYQPHGCGYPCSDSNDCDGPCTLCCWQNQTCCYEEVYYDYPLPSPPFTLQQPPSPSPTIDDDEEESDDELAPQPPSYDVAAPQPASYDEYVPYPERGCGYGPCKDSNDCGWPCTECCANQTCCHRPNWALVPPMVG